MDSDEDDLAPTQMMPSQALDEDSESDEEDGAAAASGKKRGAADLGARDTLKRSRSMPAAQSLAHLTATFWRSSDIVFYRVSASAKPLAHAAPRVELPEGRRLKALLEIPGAPAQEDAFTWDGRRADVSFVGDVASPAAAHVRLVDDEGVTRAVVVIPSKDTEGGGEDEPGGNGGNEGLPPMPEAEETARLEAMRESRLQAEAAADASMEPQGSPGEERPVEQERPAEERPAEERPAEERPAEEAKEEPAAVVPERAPAAETDDPLVLTAFAPDAEAGAEFVVAVWLHREAEMAEIAAAEKQEGRSKKLQKPGVHVQRGAVVHLAVAGHSAQLEPQDTDDDIPWNGTKANATLLVSCRAESRKPCYLRLRAEVDGKPLGKLPVLVNVEPEEAQQAPACSVWRYPSQRPHVFLSYRRTHGDLADRVRLHLEHRFHYQVFLDASPDCGLSAGNFQEQLEDKLARSKVVVPLLTPAPSGPDPRRKELTYLGCVKDAAAAGRTDWCYRELQLALAAPDKLVVPAFRGVAIGDELAGLPEDIRPLAALQCLEIVDSFFSESVQRIHEGVQRWLADQH